MLDPENHFERRSLSGTNCSFFKKTTCGLCSGVFLGGFAVLMLIPTGVTPALLFAAGWMFFQIGFNLGRFFAEELAPPLQSSLKLASSRK